MKKRVCYQCKDRKMGCRSTCERYKAEDEEYQKELTQIKKQKEIERIYNDYEAQTRKDICRGRNYHRRRESGGQ